MDAKPILRLVIISDTHNDHRGIQHIPEGDVLIHCGDWTNFGKLQHTVDFNEWLGLLTHRVKIVVNGNHESNAFWKSRTKQLLSNAVFLCQESYSISITGFPELELYGTQFSWPIHGQSNPLYNAISQEASVLITHGPAAGLVDKGSGCEQLRKKCEVLNQNGKLCLVLSGHIHGGHGRVKGEGLLEGITFVNASICGASRKAVHLPTVVDLQFDESLMKWIVLPPSYCFPPSVYDEQETDASNCEKRKSDDSFQEPDVTKCKGALDALVGDDQAPACAIM